ncbi:DUF952 domain-containing protein [Nocardiopsis alkaliphila]|uniref:DUF952 domain-containing protein n=1 Tax=Nocardiopsis alkaliphila TaxID=225762 RepID=UPI000525A100|nr:DUF952 domain-containing protein [Nocardiopsis alkaliphila]
MSLVLHLTEMSRWRRGGDIEAESLSTQGFLHASADETVMLAVANALYAEPTEPLVVLVVDTERVDAEIRWEAADPAPPPGVGPNVLFPHVFGPIPRRAVVAVRRPVRDRWGRYSALEDVEESGHPH